MTVPRATMRLQFHRGFTFADAIKIIPYIEALNISHIYSSPILKARAGSQHGYDVVDPSRINPELGGEDGFRDFVAALRAKGLGLIVDIVPNHMAVGADNPWWCDVLQNGRTSAHAKFFDIDWNAPDLDGKVLIPLLGVPYAEALEKGELQLTPTANGYEVRYFQHAFPIRSEDYAKIDAESAAVFDCRMPEGQRRLHDLLERQHYRLAWWKSANDAINWRRFFDINELAAIRCENDEVFEATHRKIFELYGAGLIDGVRIDHIDGLADPQSYCRKLRAQLEALARHRPADCASEPYIVVEKILGPGEHLSADWECDGTTGYDFMDQVSRVLHDGRGAAPLANAWHSISGRTGLFSDEENHARRDILSRSFSAQLESLVQAVFSITKQDLISRDIAAPAIRRVVIEILVHMRVYRTYARPGSAPGAGEHDLAQAVAGATRSCLPTDRDALRVVASLFAGVSALGDQWMQAEAIRKFEQLSAPLAAKAVEDTAFYRYGALLSRLDVGFDASQFGGDIDAFHREMKTRASRFPHAMLATATHDHKRGEDVRARLAVLSEISGIWQTTVYRWLEETSPLFSQFEGRELPSRGDAAILLQMIIGAWPLDLKWNDAAGCAAFEDRLAAWQTKALREAKLETEWVVPDARYEEAARDFLKGLFQAAWREKLAAFVDRVAAAGAVKGLAQTLLKLTCPGVPDFYQGTEFWDFSLVDPDNRRPVDFALRIEALSEGVALNGLLRDWRNGHIKQAIIARTLAARRQHRELFENGDYSPLVVRGAAADSVVAFMRQYRTESLLVVVPRLTVALLDRGQITIPQEHWRDTRIHLPATLKLDRLYCALSHKCIDVKDRWLPLAAISDEAPAALLFGELA